MSARTLPPNPSLEQLKKQAKDLLKGYRSGDAEAILRLRASVPKLATASDAKIQSAKFALLDARRVIAREYGFESWSALEHRVVEENVTVGVEFSLDLQPLLKAVDEGDASTVESMLLEKPGLATATVYDQDPHGETLLHRAVPDWGVETTAGHLKVAELLIDHGVDPNAIGWGSNCPAAPPLDIAAWAGHLPMVELLLAKGADPERATEGMPKPVETAASHGHKEIFKLLVDAGASYEIEHTIQLGLLEETRQLIDADPRRLEQPDMKRRLLHSAISAGNEALVNELLQRGADIDAVDGRGRTALHRAIESSWEQANPIVGLLLERGAALDIWAAAGLGDSARVRVLLADAPQVADAQQEDGITPIFWAAHKGDPQTVELLLDCGVDLNCIVQRWRLGWIPLYGAVRNGHEEVARRMLEAGADPNLRIEDDTWQRTTALATAARYAAPSMVELLLDYGADINAGEMGSEYVGLGGLGWAVYAGKVELVQLLIDRGVDLRHPNHRYIPHSAAAGGRNEVLELIARHGADLNGKNPLGQTPLAVALFKGQSQTAELLRRLGAVG